MKKILTLLFLLTICMSFLSGCSDKIDNKITFKNFASNKVFVNFRASLISVEAGESLDITEIPKGKYTYETTFEVPTGTTSSKTDGDVSGEVNLAAGTKILIVYSSTFVDGVYTISASVSSSDDLTSSGTPVSP